MYMCPYYNENYQICNFYQTSQNQSQRDNYCNTSSSWKNCPNYTCQNREYKISKTVNGRSNPDL